MNGRKKIKIVLANIFFCVVIIFIYFNEMKLAQMDAELYQDSDYEYRQLLDLR